MIDEKSISTLSREQLFDAEIFLSLFDLPPEERKRMEVLLTLRASDLGVEKQFMSVIKTYSDEDQKLVRDYKKTLKKYAGLELDKKGKPLATIENYIKIFEKDEKFKGLKFNMLSETPEQEIDGIVKAWTDNDDAEARRYVENEYGFHSPKKCDDALRIVFAKNQYHPIKDIINSIEWDGESRIYEFLIKWMKCENTPYTREVSRLIFAGGIHRLYNPGCKFDDMPVLIGTKQGEGKSTFVRWLALEDRFFNEVTEFDNQRGAEALEGAWICEVSELLALTKSKEVESVKSFLTRTNDRRRTPYDRRSTDHPRQCIFIGTTNNEQFLTDKTGNRRFFPVTVRQSGYELFNAKETIKEDIKQCWAEAKHLFDEGKLLPFADNKLADTFRKKQSEAVEDDYRIGMIEAYLEDRDEVYGIELWRDALQNNTYSKPTPKDFKAIAQIMQQFTDWERQNKSKRFGEDGVQRYWKRVVFRNLGVFEDDILP